MKLSYSELIFPKLNQGIPEKDLLALLEYVKRKRIILLLRPVEWIVRSLHEEARYPTKHFNIKGKSASWGAWAGFIPIDQAYSKLAIEADATKICKYNQEIQCCITEGYAVAVPLILSDQRFEELVETGHIFCNGQKGAYQVFQCVHPRTKEFVLFHVMKMKNIAKTEYAIFHEDQSPFEVLAQPESKKPFIPDYDLLAVIFPWSKFGPQHIRPNPDVIYSKFFQKLSPREKINSQLNEKTFYAREWPNLGNISPKIMKMLQEMNEVLGRDPNLACIHHNDDIGSPASNPTINYPITVLLPRELNINSPETFLIESPEAFVGFIRKIQEIGYRVELNPLWEKSVQFAIHRNFFDKKFNIIWHHYENGEDKKNIETDLKKMLYFIGVIDTALINKIISILFLIRETNSKIELTDYLNFIQVCLLFKSTQRIQYCQLLESFLKRTELIEEVFSSLRNFLVFIKQDSCALAERSENKDKTQEVNTFFPVVCLN